MKKTVRIGETDDYGRICSVFCRIEIDDGKLSISGVEGPKQNGNAVGGCGQITKPNFVSYAEGWSEELAIKFWDVWHNWHLNDMRAGCEHQRKEKWNKRPIDPNKPLDSYGKHFPGQRTVSWNMLAWISPDEHPEGLLGKPCPVCGYKYGTAWMREELPVEVVKFLESLPESDQVPAWV